MSPPQTELLQRNLTSHIIDLLAEEPVLVLHGARTAGKSTLLTMLANRTGASVIDLDELDVRDSVADDPALFASGPSPVLIDEFQKVPELLDAIKAELNRNLRPGRFVLTGSTRYTALPSVAQSLTGRVHIVNLWPLSQGELAGTREDFVEHLLDDPLSLVAAAPSPTMRAQYERRILAGGFPLAVRRATERGRSRWFDDYVNLVIERDVLELRKVRQRDVLPRLLRLLAAQTAQVLNVAHAADRAGLEKPTAGDYVQLLESVFLVYRLPAWGHNLGNRITAHPKIHLVDSGLAAHLLGLSAQRLASKQPAALTTFGHIVETFAVGEILRQVECLAEPLDIGHFRTRDQVEVDLVLETYDGRVFAIEIKAGSRVAGDDLRGLRTLRDKIGASFVGGVVLHLGTHSYTLEDRINAVPLDRVWTPAQDNPVPATHPSI